MNETRYLDSEESEELVQWLGGNPNMGSYQGSEVVAIVIFRTWNYSLDGSTAIAALSKSGKVFVHDGALYRGSRDYHGIVDWNEMIREGGGMSPEEVILKADACSSGGVCELDNWTVDDTDWWLHNGGRDNMVSMEQGFKSLDSWCGALVYDVAAKKWAYDNSSCAY